MRVRPSVCAPDLAAAAGTTACSCLPQEVHLVVMRLALSGIWGDVGEICGRCRKI